MVATAVIGSAVIGGVGSAIASSNASGAQKSAANKAAATQQNMFNQTQANLSPYMTAGRGDLNALTSAANAAGPATLKTFDPSQAWLESTPGYQFNMQQGLKATQNSAAARGLGVSGAALKGAANYSTGLAQSNYGTYANNLLAGAQLGESAAAQTGQAGTAAANAESNNTTGAGSAVAAGATGAAN